MTDLVNAGADEVKRANYRNKLEQWRAMQESGCHVATSQRRDVSNFAMFPTSRRWVNQCRSQQFKTSRRLNVATPQRRDVSTSRRQLEICTSSFKYEWLRNQGREEVYERGQGIPEQSDTDFEEVPGICTVSHFVGY